MANSAPAILRLSAPFTAIHRLVATAILFAVASASVHGDPTVASLIYGSSKDAILRVQSTGELYDHDHDTEQGTAFVIDTSGLALTANHVTFTKKNYYKSITIKVFRGENGDEDQRSAEVLASDLVHDIALLQIDGPHLPLSLRLGDSSKVNVGDWLGSLGFPLTFHLSVDEGIVKSKQSDDQWMTNMSLNFGNSGGPLFASDGAVVGVATSGVVEAYGYAAEGIKFFAPVSSFSQFVAQGLMSRLISPNLSLDDLFLKTSAEVAVRPGLLPPNLNEWTQSNARPTIRPKILEGHPLPDRFSRSFSVEEVLEEHGIGSTTRAFVKEFRPDQGYIATGAKLIPNSANFVSNQSAEIVDGGHRIVVKFSLTSGPAWDQYRAWLSASIGVTQERITR